MDCLLSHIPPSLRSLAQTYGPSVSENAPLLGVALVSVAAIYAGFLYLLAQREAAVAFNVPLPPELRKGWTGRKWEEVQGQDKRVLEDQVRGVSFEAYCLFFLSFLGCYKISG